MVAFAKTQMRFIGSKQTPQVPVGPVGLGLMNFTNVPVPVSDEQAFEAMKTALNGGANLWNSGEFYGKKDPEDGIKLIARYFEKYPEDSSRVFLVVKGAVIGGFKPDGSPQGVRKSVENINRLLRGTKKLDLFECARVDPKVPIEETIASLAKLIGEGLFDHIGLSEVSAESVRRAHKVHPISAVEIEYSLWSTEVEKNGTIKACEELGIPVVAYAPLGRGFLTGQIKKFEDIPEGDNRRQMPRFQPDVFNENIKLVHKLELIAKKKKVTPAQLAVAWILVQKPYLIPIPGSITEGQVEENNKAIHITFSEEELKEIRSLVDNEDVIGGRYPDVVTKLWDDYTNK